MEKKIELGKQAKDKITGFVGVVTVRCEYLDGSRRAMIEGSADGRPVEMWVEESRLEVVTT